MRVHVLQRPVTGGDWLIFNAVTKIADTLQLQPDFGPRV